MLITKPFQKKDYTESTILNQQYNRLIQLTSPNMPGSEYWLGYISAYSSLINQKTNKLFTMNDWISLSSIIKNVIELAQNSIIRKENVFELMVYAVQEQLEASSRKKQAGIDITRVGEAIQYNLEGLMTDTHYLRNKYFKGYNSIEKKEVKQIQKNQSNTNSLKKTKSQIKKPMPKQEEIDINLARSSSMALGIQCPICLQQITLATVCPVSCGHNLHKECFIGHFQSRVEVKKFPIICPQNGCNKQIAIQDIQQYIPKEMLQKFYEFSLHEFVDKNRKNINWCPTPGCSAVFSIQGDLAHYSCVACKKEYCLKCKTQAHPTLTCEQNKSMVDMPEDEKQFVNFARGAQMKQCPNCKFWVQKNKGCDHMTCRCKYQFCFRCGAKYGECSCNEADSYYGDEDDDDGDGSGYDDQNREDYEQSQEQQVQNEVLPEIRQQLPHPSPPYFRPYLDRQLQQPVTFLHRFFRTNVEMSERKNLRNNEEMQKQQRDQQEKPKDYRLFWRDK